MALANIDPQKIKDALREWLASKLSVTVSIDGLDISSASGMSNTTRLFNPAWLDGETPTTHELPGPIAPNRPATFKAANRRPQGPPTAAPRAPRPPGPAAGKRQ